MLKLQVVVSASTDQNIVVTWRDVAMAAVLLLTSNVDSGLCELEPGARWRDAPLGMGYLEEGSTRNWIAMNQDHK